MLDRPVDEGPVAKANVGGLTNGIIAFSFLLLFFTIRMPDSAPGAGSSIAEQFWMMQLADILNFLTVFLILAMVWSIVFHIFHQTAWIDRTFLYLHLLLLMLVIFLPITNDFTTLVQDVFFSILFHLNMLGIGLVLFFEWRHCHTRPALLRHGVQKDGTPFARMSLLVIPLIAIAGCVLAACHIRGTQYLYFLALPAFFILMTWMPDRWRSSRPVMIRTPRIPASGGEFQEAHGAVFAVPHEMLGMIVCATFAFAMTLIVRTNVHLPSITAKTVTVLSASYLEGLLTRIFNFLFVFIIISIFFILFFEILQKTRANDGIVISLSFMFILSILFIPLTSVIWSISDKPDLYGVIFHANVLVSGLLAVLLWRHISKTPALRKPAVDPALIRNLSLRLFLFPVTAVVGIILDSWDWAFETIPFGLLYIVPVILFVYFSRESGIAAQPKTC